MKITITPDYCRYTEFTLEERMMLADLARVRWNTVTTYLLVRSQRKHMAEGQADSSIIDHLEMRLAHLRWTIDAIDTAILDIYAEHGRLN